MTSGPTADVPLAPLGDHREGIGTAEGTAISELRGGASNPSKGTGLGSRDARTWRPRGSGCPRAARGPRVRPSLPCHLPPGPSPAPAPQPASCLVSLLPPPTLPSWVLPSGLFSHPPGFLSLSLLPLLPLTLFSTWARTWALPHPAKATWPHTKQSLVPPETSLGFTCHRFGPLETFVSLGGHWADCTGHRGSSGWEALYL